jgi:hypothetical protein
VVASSSIIRANADGSKTIMPTPTRALASNEFTMLEYNFSLLLRPLRPVYMATLVADDTPLDRYLAGNARALSASRCGG